MKKLLVLVLSVAMLLSFAACSDSTNDNDDDVDKKNKSDIVNDDSIVGESVNVGEYITFGSYEQDNDTSNGKEPIEWLVLDEENGKVLVISKYALDAKPFNEELDDVTWETCTLRSWLNDDFINEAFTSNERAAIPMVTVAAEANNSYDTDPGNDTQDKVFLLSIYDVNEHFDSDSAKECKATDYAIAQGAWIIDTANYAGNCSWWLRSLGGQSLCAAIVNDIGYTNGVGVGVASNHEAVRPAMWIEL